MATLQNECSLPESIRCYLLRGNVMVPLVPADQLPYQLKGVPRHLSHRQMSDEGWKLFKETKEVPFLLSFQTPPTSDSPSQYSPGRPQYLAPDHQVRTESQVAQKTPNRAIQRPLAAIDTPPESPDALFTGVVERLSPLTDAVASIYPNDALRLGYNSPTGCGIPKKVYCTHWIATGECRWTLTGCKYKHEMPGTEKLRELGFTRGTPKWWKDKNAVSPPKSLTWMQRRLVRMDDEEPQTADMPSPRAFPDPSTLRTRRLEERSGDLNNETQKKAVAPKEEQPVTSKPSLSMSPSIQTSPICSLPQTPNLIDLEDVSMLSGSSVRSHDSNTDSNQAFSPCETLYDISMHPLSSSPLLLSPPPRPSNRKTKTTKPHHTRKPLSPPSSSSSSPPSSSPEASSDTDTDSNTPLTRTRKLQHGRKIPTHRKNTRTTTAATTTTSTSPRPIKNPKNAQQQSQLGLASSKYAVQTVVSSSAAPRLRQEKEARVEQSARKVQRKERKGERSG